MISVPAFLSKIAEIESEHPRYRLGGSGKDGTCDCIGLVIGAIRRAGGSWTGVHGSNWAARNEVRRLYDTNMAKPGDVVFKFHQSGSSSNKLPSRYANHPDRNDYYHVGVVTSVAPLRIIHCTSSGGVSGIKADTAWGQWSRAAELKAVDYAVPAAPAGIDKKVLLERIDSALILLVDLKERIKQI